MVRVKTILLTCLFQTRASVLLLVTHHDFNIIAPQFRREDTGAVEYLALFLDLTNSYKVWNYFANISPFENQNHL